MNALAMHVRQMTFELKMSGRLARVLFLTILSAAFESSLKSRYFHIRNG